MKIRFNYYLKIKSIMEKDYDIFEIDRPTTIRDIFNKNIISDKLDKIDLSEILIICDEKNIESLDMLIDSDINLSICPKIYGG